MRKPKYKSIKKMEFEKWIQSSNYVARSLLSANEVLHQFNNLTYDQRINIRRMFKEYDEIRNRKIPRDEKTDSAWMLSVLVDSHIIATEYDIDPLCAVMCINPPCQPNEKIIVK